MASLAQSLREKIMSPARPRHPSMRTKCVSFFSVFNSNSFDGSKRFMASSRKPRFSQAALQQLADQPHVARNATLLQNVLHLNLYVSFVMLSLHSLTNNNPKKQQPRPCRQGRARRARRQAFALFFFGLFHKLTCFQIQSAALTCPLPLSVRCLSFFFLSFLLFSLHLVSLPFFGSSTYFPLSLEHLHLDERRFAADGAASAGILAKP